MKALPNCTPTARTPHTPSVLGRQVERHFQGVDAQHFSPGEEKRVLLQGETVLGSDHQCNIVHEILGSVDRRAVSEVPVGEGAAQRGGLGGWGCGWGWRTSTGTEKRTRMGERGDGGEDLEGPERLAVGRATQGGGGSEHARAKMPAHPTHSQYPIPDMQYTNNTHLDGVGARGGIVFRRHDGFPSPRALQGVRRAQRPARGCPKEGQVVTRGGVGHTGDPGRGHGGLAGRVTERVCGGCMRVCMRGVG